MGLFHRGKKNNDDEPDSVQTFFYTFIKEAVRNNSAVHNNSRRRTHRSVSRFGTRGSTWREHMGCPSGSSCRWLNAGRC